MFKILPKYSHTYTYKDILYSISGFSKDYSRELKKQLSIIFPNKYFFFVDSGRTGFSLLLKSLNLPKGSQVAIPVDVCEVVVEVILENGLEPLIIDIDDNLTMSGKDLKQKISKKTKAILIVYSYGNIPDIKNLLNIAKKHNCFIIEDMAQTFNPRYDNINLCNLGVGSFISLDATKHISAFRGGILIMNDKYMYNKIKREILKREGIVKDLYRFLSLLSFIILTNNTIYRVITKRIVKHIKKTSYYKPSYKRLSKVGVALTYSQVKKLSRIDNARKKNALKFIDLLKNKDIKLHVDMEKKQPTFLFLPIGINKIDSIKETLESGLIDLPRPSPLLIWSKRYEKYWTNCPNAERIRKELMLLPTYKKIDRHINEISNILIK